MLGVSLTAKRSALSCLLCHYSKRRRRIKKGWKHAGCFEGICFPFWNWMHFTHNGMKLTILDRHRIRVHGCHSYFPWTMNTDVEWDRAGTVGTMHEGLKDWGITYTTEYNTQEDYTPSGLNPDTMHRDFKAILLLSRTFLLFLWAYKPLLLENIWRAAAACISKKRRFPAVSHTVIFSLPVFKKQFKSIQFSFWKTQRQQPI